MDLVVHISGKGEGERIRRRRRARAWAWYQRWTKYGVIAMLSLVGWMTDSSRSCLVRFPSCGVGAKTEAGDDADDAISWEPASESVSTRAGTVIVRWSLASGTLSQVLFSDGGRASRRGESGRRESRLESKGDEGGNGGNGGRA